MHLSQTTFDAIRQTVHSLCGLALGDDKAYLVRDRLGPLIARRGWHSFEELRERLQQGRDSQLAEAVIDAMTTHETSFFRDPHVFEALRTDILPRLATKTEGLRHRLRIWSAGTSTGQEAFSLAMLINESLARCPGLNREHVLILGTDVSQAALLTAQSGEYASREMDRGLSAARVSRFFESSGDKYRIRPVVRNLVDFRRFNLCGELASLGQFELICCRNVLIYFDDATRQRICRQLHSMLSAEGCLLLGAAENLYGISNDFVSVPMGQTVIYRKA